MTSLENSPQKLILSTEEKALVQAGTQQDLLGQDREAPQRNPAQVIADLQQTMRKDHSFGPDSEAIRQLGNYLTDPRYNEFSEIIRSDLFDFVKSDPAQAPFKAAVTALYHDAAGFELMREHIRSLGTQRNTSSYGGGTFEKYVQSLTDLDINAVPLLTSLLGSSSELSSYKSTQLIKNLFERVDRGEPVIEHILGSLKCRNRLVNEFVGVLAHRFPEQVVPALIKNAQKSPSFDAFLTLSYANGSELGVKMLTEWVEQLSEQILSRPKIALVGSTTPSLPSVTTTAVQPDVPSSFWARIVTGTKAYFGGSKPVNTTVPFVVKEKRASESKNDPEYDLLSQTLETINILLHPHRNTTHAGSDYSQLPRSAAVLPHALIDPVDPLVRAHVALISADPAPYRRGVVSITGIWSKLIAADTTASVEKRLASLYASANPALKISILDAMSSAHAELSDTYLTQHRRNELEKAALPLILESDSGTETLSSKLVFMSAFEKSNFQDQFWDIAARAFEVQDLQETALDFLFETGPHRSEFRDILERIVQPNAPYKPSVRRNALNQLCALTAGEQHEELKTKLIAIAENDPKLREAAILELRRLDPLLSFVEQSH